METSFLSYSLPQYLEEKVETYTSHLEFNGNKVIIYYPKNLKEMVEDIYKKLPELKESFQEEYEAKDIIKIFDKVTKNWKRKDYDLRKEAEELLPISTRFNEKAIHHYLDALFRMDKSSMKKMIKTQIGKIEYLDDFSKSSVGYSRLFGPEYVVHIFGETVGPQPLSFLEASLLKSPSLAKISEREPIFTTLVVKSIKDVESDLGNYIFSLPWKGGDEEIEGKLFSNENSCIVVYGTEDTIEDVRQRAKSKVIDYPRRVGLEVIENRRKKDATKKVALDVAMFDQHACFSPHCVYVEGEKENAKEFAEELAMELRNIEKEIPRGYIDIDKASVISMEKMTQNLLKHSGIDIEIYDNRKSLVIYEETPHFKTSCLDRVVYVKPLESIEKLPEYLKNVKGYLQTVGVSMSFEKKKKLAELLYPLGVSRITECGKIAYPRIEWHHEGRSPLQEMGKWVDIEV